jgi:NAD(P)-dependent dehydrogenase (short-subunit alcohol dehydrogenase family)
MAVMSNMHESVDQPLGGRVAVVAGATRGGGRGIAAALGEAGATVVCTGRSSRTGAVRSDYDRPETIEETAELVTALGGVGIAEVVDHLDPAQVAALADRIRADHGHIDVLVDDIWGGEELTGPPTQWERPVWEVDLAAGLRLLRLGVETHLVTVHHLLPLVVAEPGGLLVEVTDGTTTYNADHYRISAFYDLAKTSVNRLAWSLGHELGSRGATAMAVTPGWMRSEMMLEAFSTTEESWRDSVDPDRPGGPTAPPGFAASESPRYVGRGIAAVAADPERARWNQRSVTAGELAEHYGVTDVDGSRPQCWRMMAAEEAGEVVDPADFR